MMPRRGGRARYYVIHLSALAFQLLIGLDMEHCGELTSRPLSLRDVAAGSLVLCQLRGRTLPVASARFGLALATALEQFSDD